MWGLLKGRDGTVLVMQSRMNHGIWISDSEFAHLQCAIFQSEMDIRR